MLLLLRAISATLLSIYLFSGQVLADVSIVNNQMSYFVEQDKALSIDEAKSYLKSGKFTQSPLKNISFGVNSNPVWMHYQVENSSDQPLAYRLTTGVSWIDYQTLYFENSENIKTDYHAGDRIAGAPYILPSKGIAFMLEFTPGINNIFIRASTVDPIIFLSEIETPEEAAISDSSINLKYGILYGFLIALITSNLMFYRVLGNDIYLYYSLVVGSFLFVNVGYTGQGMYRIWSEYPDFQNFCILTSMVLYSVLILSFGSRFLKIREHSIKLYKIIRAFQLSGLLSIGFAILIQSQSLSSYIAFAYLAMSATLMLFISIINIKRADEGRYFFIAVSCGMAGMITTDFSVMGIIPFTSLTFHMAEAGITLEASIFALALTRQIRMREISRIKSEKLASFDPLTELHNRRSFYESIIPVMSRISNNNRALCIIMIDADNFKKINDNYGHNIGDEALKIISKRVKAKLRKSDIAVRWGGEEILLFLPDTNMNNALQLAERIRLAIEKNPLIVDKEELNITISLGVSQYNNHDSIEDLIDEADHALLDAKGAGRNRTEAYQSDSEIQELVSPAS